MIRNVVVGRLHDGVEPSALGPGLEAVVALEPPGLVSVVVGLDAGLREQSWDFAITSDFVDEEAYRAYDEDEEHNRVRRELFAPLCAEIARVQVRC
ncbi:Dabb family protein [uncultured Pseudokineococcus sp.]|uniref:Dabb family protein n=1 Tax=uncultured Pseudokineococcus sp. TaxID=1642928 RepID=UPI002603197C|nr:Dabb family protein [uncultured Pseudokineococcus sp.]